MLSYSEIYERDIKLGNTIWQDYGSDEKAWNLFYEYYKDPDGYPIIDNKYKRVGDIICTADSLLSIKRIKYFQGFGEDFIDIFKKYRKMPIFFFPREKGGINGLRAILLEDRIDHTLLDLKRYCSGEQNCILCSAYNQPKTKRWLEYFDYDFENIVEWMGIKGIFVTNNTKCEIFNLEKSDNSSLNEFKEKYIHPRNSNYLSAWSFDYYENIKKKIVEYEMK